ncbi:DUF1858 domain-containing protein [Rhodopseudomonas sp. P2A-2r]|nr:DUF1858 domain-containing protein [Rhodopseudomonas sp. P2A-2r]
MEQVVLTPDMMVDEVIRRWPATVRTFLDFHLGCVGCPVAGFHSVGDASICHAVGPAFLLALCEVAGGDDVRAE